VTALLVITVTCLAAVVGALSSLLVRANRLGEIARAELLELRRSGYRKLIGRRVVAQLAGDRSVRGVLVASYSDGHTLAHPEWLAQPQPAPMGGELFLPAEKVLLLQVFEGDEG
jgi:hypothetical protein